jgi:elongator complex protein 3
MQRDSRDREADRGLLGRRQRSAFDPAPHARELAAIIDAIEAEPALDARGLDRILKRHPRDGRGLFARSEILAGHRALRPGDPDAERFAARLRLRPVRSLSGVTPVTVLTRPFPCPGRCVFCPDDARMPKSYLSAEPGCQRAAQNGFDPYRQTWSRLAAYRAIGHPLDKVELIVLGGTWSAYPASYRRGFVARCLEALGDFASGIDRRGQTGDVEADAEALERAQRSNETAGSRCVGLSVETRPDHVDEREVEHLRRLGVTKVQLGVQSLSDRVLERNRRGHDVSATRRAFRLLRGAGFKIHAHWMPNLLGATPRSDRTDFARLFDDPDFRPDELKIYPCLLVESAELTHHHRSGAWRPYPDEVLVELLADCLERTPPWCRVTRVVRDFSAGDIVAGTHRANLREVAERRLRETGRRLREVRSREVRGTPPASLRLSEIGYATSSGEERFLQWTTPDDRLAGFLRLALPRLEPSLPELAQSAVVREVHVYGASLALGRRDAGGAQHRGLGRALLARAAAIARTAGYPDLAVISAVGTRPYYRRLGFRDGALYQHRCLARAPASAASPARGASGSVTHENQKL